MGCGMGDEYGRMEWQTDEAAATAEAVRRIEAAIASGAKGLDFTDLIAMTRLPDALAKAQGVREIYAGVVSPIRALDDNFLVKRLTSISALAGLTKLTSLHIDSTQVSNLSALSGLSGLTSLNLNYTPVSDLSALSGLSGLTSLNLNYTPVSDLSALSGLSGLTSLSLSYTPVSDLSALSDLSGLTSLDLSSTSVSDLSALSGLSGLTALDLRNTQVSDLGILMSFPLFASEQAKFLRYSITPAAHPQADRRLDYLSRLPPDRCAIETVQYLKGTHPYFGETKIVNQVGNGAGLAARLAEASPVEVVLEGGLLQARNAGTPERLAPKELGLRVTALREQVGSF